MVGYGIAFLTDEGSDKHQVVEDQAHYKSSWSDFMVALNTDIRNRTQ
jgi:hypothetical protein